MIASLFALAIGAPAAAQMHDMPGMRMPARTAVRKPAVRAPIAKRASTTTAGNPPQSKAPPETGPAMATPGMATPGVPSPAADPCPPEHAAMGHCVASPAAGGLGGDAAGTDQEAGDAPAPAPPATRAADAFYDAGAMAAADRSMRAEHGGMAFSQVLFNIAEWQVRNGRDGYRWDGEGWFGGDIHRIVVKSEGEGTLGRRIDTAEVRALYSRTLDPYWNLQAGFRQDIGTGARRTYATIGIEGLAPYWFDVEGTVFLSTRGDLLARAEAWYDQRVTQRLILQPRATVNLSAQDAAASRIGAGLSTAEAGLRLRYEIAREFAPYVGVTWERRYGATARFARAAGEESGGFALALGIRGWF